MHRTSLIRLDSKFQRYLNQARKSVTHGWHWTKTGFQLFYGNLKTSRQIAKKRFKGYPLTFSEYKMLTRTTTDLVKLIPFSFFIIVPFAEFALPIVLHFFPNMLPSTFQNSFKQEDNNLRKELTAKQLLAQSLQEMVEQHISSLTTLDLPEITTKTTILSEIQKNIQQKSKYSENIDVQYISIDEILEFAKLFKSDLQLENMTIETLGCMSKIIGIKPYGLKSIDILRLRYHLLSIMNEDRQILWEGVGNLDYNELIECCKARAIRFLDIPEKEMRRQLIQWLKISSIPDISAVVLLWIRAIHLNHL
ncbi:uncharacterized protein CMU_039960 [Cryptosporidium muris RN66]|uniref:Letm1 RBD domain-containing protein n=1 Tax=Cryptosporidium muris (strain RN66) TaxID=441375 RepID=B6A9N6_CRYMR|nr:uncharacterized protein CMU_039960 [Cryptosporidium muris RN66]EEA04927.1 hypothetical protein, conserved [Cryptosporidium muris RN66]|eukprot:XP_002139276.1 hypothetical protein [Cryptosporidium muris RN66]